MMIKPKLSSLVKIAGVVMGAITALTLISQNPVKVAFLGASAVIWFVGAYLKRKGK